MDKPHDYCGIFGAFNVPNASEMTYYGLHALQHRGQESCGIVTSTYDETRKRWVMPVHKGAGLVLDVFEDKKLFEEKLLGNAAIGHNRYSTSGSSRNAANIQPFVVHYRGGNLALAHNGNLSNTEQLHHRFQEKGTIFQTTSDSELILHLIAQSRKDSHIERILDAVEQVEGAYSLVILTDEHLIAVRDPNGFRPLCLGRLGSADTPGGAGYVVASETCAFDLIGAEYVRDIEPAEVLVIDRKGCVTGNFQSHRLEQPYGTSQCIFEYVYFARPDSKIFGEMTDKVRRKIGKQLAHEVPVPVVPEDDPAPIVISVPDSSNTATLGYVTECNKLGFRCRYEIGLIRNHYVGRTFIAPGQNQRELKVRCKFNTVEGVLKDRVVVVVDDSIVRGTTSRLLVKMIRQAGAAAVHFRVTSPPVVSPCFYGMDFPSKEELLAPRFDSDLEDMAQWLGVDTLAYLSADGLLKAVQAANPTGAGYCTACFTSKYPVPVNMQTRKEQFEW